ncbi:MAG: class I SAM-dependent methyltransferase [Myxococcota bacterium]
MTSTQRDIEVSYDVSNEFFRLWLDENMHYTSASFLTGHESLEQAQLNKCKILYDYADMNPDKLVLDVGCGWGANIQYHVLDRGTKAAHGITLSTEQAKEIERRKLPGVKVSVVDYREFSPDIQYDAVQSIEMIDHLCSPAQAREGKAVDIYREYFAKIASWVKPGACFGFQAILRNVVPRRRQDLEDLQFTADVIFPGGLNPRLEELIMAAQPAWEVLELRTQRESYGRTTGEWLRRMKAHEDHIRHTWGDKLYEDYDRYLSTCVRAFANHWSSDVQMKLRKV